MIKLSYFSYKGGAGRSSVAYNTIPYLVKKLNATSKNPILVIDLDLDSAGLTFLLKKQGANIANYSIQSALAEAVSGALFTPSLFDIKHHPIFSKCIPVGECFGLDNDSKDAVLFIPAEPGKAINLESASNYDAGNVVRERFRSLINFCEKYEFKAVLFDTPAGDQLTANWSLEYSNVIATCMRITYQFRSGTVNYLKRILPRFHSKKFIIIPNAVPTDEIIINGFSVNYESIKDQLEKELLEIDVGGNAIDLTLLGCKQDFFGVNEIKRFKIQEDILFRIPDNFLADDEKKAISAYKMIVDSICG